MKTEEYINAVNTIELSEEQKERVIGKVMRANRSNRSGCMMWKKKMVLTAAAVVVVMSITAFAVSGLVTSWIVSSSEKPEYTSLPTAEQCEKDIGYAPILLEQFSNGYAFKEGSVGNNRLENDSGTVVERFRSLHLRYQKDGDTVFFAQEKYASETQEEQSSTVAETVDGIDLYYSSDTYRFVPADYQLTAEEKRLEESGDVIFSYGSDEISEQQVQCVSWSVGDRHYSLMQMDGALSAEELLAMAEEVIHS